MLEAQLNYRIEAHKCELGTLTRGTLVTIGSGPNSKAVCNVYDAVKLLNDTGFTRMVYKQSQPDSKEYKG